MTAVEILKYLGQRELNDVGQYLIAAGAHYIGGMKGDPTIIRAAEDAYSVLMYMRNKNFVRPQTITRGMMLSAAKETFVKDFLGIGAQNPDYLRTAVRVGVHGGIHGANIYLNYKMFKGIKNRLGARRRALNQYGL